MVRRIRLKNDRSQENDKIGSIADTTRTKEIIERPTEGWNKGWLKG
jgi:hypothetical protein